MHTQDTPEKSKNTSPVAAIKTTQQPFFAPVKVQLKQMKGSVNEPDESQTEDLTGKEIQTPVQRKENPFPPDVQAKMESAFNEDFSSVRIQTNSRQAENLNALAYTQGEEIYFAPGQYSPNNLKGQQLIGHELTHIVQQRNGVVTPTVQAKGFNINNDKGLEQEADAMGEKAAGSVPAEPYHSGALKMRNDFRSIQMARNGVVQLASFPTHYGEFKEKTYKPVKKEGVEIELEFHPGPVVNATKIGLTQMLKSELGGTSAPIGPTQAERMVTGGWAEGSYLDRIAERNNPIYGGQQLGVTDSLNVTKDAGTNYHLGWNFTDATGLHTKEAYLYDRPTRHGRGKNSGQTFETTALATDGVQAGTYYGSVSWGWETDDAGKFSILPIEVRSKSVPTERFFKAAEKWNAATSLGTIKTTADPTAVYNASFKKSFTVPKDEIVTIQGARVHKNIIYQDISVVTTGKTGRIKTGDLKDQGDGRATVNLPIVSEI